jgi:BolA protein
MAVDRVQMIRQRLTAALAPSKLEIRDDSARHAGHPGARSGGGHFSVYVVSERFTGKSLLERHRAVYEAMGDAMRSDIHALSIQARTPQEELAGC